VEIAKPVRCVGAVQPATNPIITPMANTMSALKGKNAIIISPHPRAGHCTAEVVGEWRALLRKHNAPEDLIQVVENSTIEKTAELMRSVDVIVATGGPGMVKAAYSSGKPSYGVGPGNIQCIIDRGIDLKEGCKKIIYSRIFDNGIICSGDQGLIIPKEMYDDFLRELKTQIPILCKMKRTRNAHRSLIPPGKDKYKSRGATGVQDSRHSRRSQVPPNTVMLAVPVNGDDVKNPLRRRKNVPGGSSLYV